eukprot:TRINITY_DN2030_c0_g2_i1.p1 TRINITY_DN2030_c0_g2~~TRINITY_DN2030_c0_g2_i1.p1  ORF type:complete len:348 (-),score=31.59 TRINITY_DN2030_c0_g2_i1:1559-2527(-)
MLRIRHVDQIQLKEQSRLPSARLIPIPRHQYSGVGDKQHYQLQRRFQSAAFGNSSSSSSNQGYNLDDYVEATVKEVVNKNGRQYTLYLRLNDGRQSELPIYIGDSEFQSISKALKKIPQSRPLTHDLFFTVMEDLGYRVSHVMITELKFNTFFARIFITKKGIQNLVDKQQLEFDARPSDAIGLACRFHATILVNKSLVENQVTSYNRVGYYYDFDHNRDTYNHCQAEIEEYKDPLFLLDLKRDIAVKEDRFEDALQLCKQRDDVILKDKLLSLMCAMESALQSQRFEEAAQFRAQIAEMKRTHLENSALFQDEADISYDQI